MRKALMPLVATLALAGGATGLLIAGNAQAQQAVAGFLATAASAPQAKKPVMLALAKTDRLADDDTAAPPDDGPGMMMMDRGQRLTQLCKDMYAHKVGELAFLETKLALTPAQAPLFARWKQASLDIARRHQDECARFQPPKGKPGIAKRLTMEEKLLKIRLADIQAERPSLEALAAALTPQQQAELDHAGMRGMGGRMHLMMGMMGRGNMRYRLDQEPDGPPPPQ